MKTRFFFIFLIWTFFGFSQEKEVLWNSKKRLSWKDFKAAPPKNARAAATTASGITYEFSSTHKGAEVLVEYEISTFFYPYKSWYQPNLANDIILSHEQLHFDISELFARKMRKEMSRTKFTENVKSEVRGIYRRILKELKDFQNMYDDDTNFSRNTENQLLWNKRIAEALQRQEQY
ncbi:DUF922 domain-containing protein [Costertonia aggregata]|uniref:DUF922 domain-containing protein n=1 Tax=Costertonia aggregata TaxID=343403 RepID=UPI001D14B22A|nr:DUF922 domain-containing protein [Costertonia aggregata]